MSIVRLVCCLLLVLVYHASAFANVLSSVDEDEVPAFNVNNVSEIVIKKTPKESGEKVIKRMPAQTAARYRGIFDVRVIEPNLAQYILGVKFTAGFNKPIHFLLRPYNGKASIETFLPIYVNNNGEDKRSFKINHKYYVSLRIREDSDSHFSAHISLFKRKVDPNLDINKPYRYQRDDFVEVSAGQLKGEFNKVNEYLFVDRKDLKFYFKLNFDILFTEQEIIRRFQSKTR